MKRRWYDNLTNVDSILKYIEELDQADKTNLIKDLVSSATLIRSSNKEKVKSSVSIGADKILNLYKAQNKRRWYDSRPELATIMNTISTLPENDFIIIMDSLRKTIDKESK